MASERIPVILGVDTHADMHVAAALDNQGRLLGVTSVAATPVGHRQLLRWARSVGDLDRVGIEGTGSYGAELARYLIAQGITTLEVNRPNRQRRRRLGKSDPVDAETAARSVLAGDATAIPKTRDGLVEAIRVLRVARRSAIKARTAATNQITGLLVTAPDQLRARFRGLGDRDLVHRCARLRPAGHSDTVSATKLALRTLARRYQSLSTEIEQLDSELERLTRQAAPRLLEIQGVGTDVAGALLVTAGDNADRLTSDAALAAVCGTSPVEASSGKTQRHRLNRGGDRQANNALWRIVVTRLSHCPRTQAYVQRRTTEGLSKPEIIRCLKRYVAREVYHALITDLRLHPAT